jgi:hypothetical protein
MDGHPRFAIDPGQTYVYEFTDGSLITQPVQKNT